jgi:hypothetical protein
MRASSPLVWELGKRESFISGTHYTKNDIFFCVLRVVILRAELILDGQVLVAGSCRQGNEY